MTNYVINAGHPSIATVWYHDGIKGGHNGDIVIHPEYGAVPTNDPQLLIAEQLRRCDVYGWQPGKIEVHGKGGHREVLAVWGA